MLSKLKRFQLLLVFAIISFIVYQTASLRSIGYERIPTIGIFDERNYVMQGLSLRRYGIPMGWSDSGAYEHTQGKIINVKIVGFTIRINDQIPNLLTFKDFPKPITAVEQFDFGLGMQHLKLVMPFIDHSPLGGIIMSLGVPDSAKEFLDLKPEHFRNMNLTIAIISSILIFILSFLITNEVWVGIIAVILYGLVPTYLLSSRYSLLENVLAPIALLHLIMILISHKLLSKNNKLSFYSLILAALTGGLVVLVKETGIGFVLGSLIIMFYLRFPRKSFPLFLSIATIPVICYIAYVLYLSPKLFFEILSFNATRRFFGSLNFLSMLPSLRFPDFPYDGWWIWGFVSLLLIGIKEGKKYLILLIPILGHLGAILLFSSLNYPWYYLSLIPFLTITSAWSLWYLFNTPSLPILIVFFLIPLSSSFYWGYTVFHLPPQILSYRILFFIFFFFSALRLFKSKDKRIRFSWKIFCFVLFLVIVRWNTRSILYIIAHWQKLPFPSLPAF